MKTETLTVMLVDVVGSTSLVERASREQLVEMMEDVTSPIRHAVHEFGGAIIKFTGDGYMAAFRSASEALHSAARIVESFNALPTLPTGEKLDGCRVVLNTCDCIVQDMDLLGEGVVAVARLEKHVPANEIYLTNTVRDVAKSAEFEYEPVGDLLLRGLANPVKVFRLVTTPFSGIERNVYLTITDLIGMSHFMTESSVELVNRVMQQWISLQRDAIGDDQGRLRSIVGDNLVTTHETADDAAEALMRLDKLVQAHNEERGDMPEFQYSAATCKGDLFVLSLGVNGPLVSRTFRLLNQIEPGRAIFEDSVYRDLTRYHDQFTAAEIKGQKVHYRR